jgi:mono/diheme cytochrome c family protein
MNPFRLRRWIPGSGGALSVFSGRGILWGLAVAVALSCQINRASVRGEQPEPGAIPSPSPGSTSKKQNMALESAHQHYRRYCVRCHSTDFAGKAGVERGSRLPDFTSAPWQKSRNDDQLLVSIQEGKGTRMPAFANELTKEDSRNLVLLIRKASPEGMPPAPAVAESEFLRRCIDLCKEREDLRRQFEKLTKASSK